MIQTIDHDEVSFSSDSLFESDDMSLMGLARSFLNWLSLETLAYTKSPEQPLNSESLPQGCSLPPRKSPNGAPAWGSAVACGNDQKKNLRACRPRLPLRLSFFFALLWSGLADRVWVIRPRHVWTSVVAPGLMRT